MTTTIFSTRFIVLLEYSQPCGAGIVGEQLAYWELDGPRYCLHVRQRVSPHGDTDEAWLSAAVADKAALWPLLEEWARARRVNVQAVTDARRALAQIAPAPEVPTGEPGHGHDRPHASPPVDEAGQPRPTGAISPAIATRPPQRVRAPRDDPAAAQRPAIPVKR
jgi:hypothetical protein